MGLSKQEKARRIDHAKMIYLLEPGVTNIEIAERVKTTVQSVGKWIKEGNWSMLRASLTITREEDLRRLYNRLSFFNDSIAQLEDEYKFNQSYLDKNPIEDGKKLRAEKKEEFYEYRENIETRQQRILNNITKLSDSVSKVGAAIKSLESDGNVGDDMKSYKQLINRIRMNDHELAQQVTVYADEIIKEKLSKS